jgi:hypothetical protein
MHAEGEFDTVAAQNLAECLTQRPGLAREQVRGALNEHHLAAQSTNGLRHLDPDRPTPEHQQPTGTVFMPVTSRLVQIPSRPRRPGTGGMRQASTASMSDTTRCRMATTSIFILFMSKLLVLVTHVKSGRSHQKRAAGSIALWYLRSISADSAFASGAVV